MSFIRLLTAATALVVLAGCSQPPAPTTQAQAPIEGDIVVRMKNLRFAPQAITVPVGTTVFFVNDEHMLHDVIHAPTQGAPEFKSPALRFGQHWSIEFDTPGTYPIHCEQGAHHRAGMVGTIIVEGK